MKRLKLTLPTNLKRWDDEPAFGVSFSKQGMTIWLWTKTLFWEW